MMYSKPAVVAGATAVVVAGLLGESVGYSAVDPLGTSWQSIVIGLLLGSHSNESEHPTESVRPAFVQMASGAVSNGSSYLLTSAGAVVISL